MFEGTEYDWQNLSKKKQKVLVKKMLEKIKLDFPDEMPAEKISLLVMNRMMFDEMPDIDYNRVVRDVFGKNADTVIQATSKLKEVTDNVTIRDPDGNILVSPENDRNL